MRMPYFWGQLIGVSTLQILLEHSGLGNALPTRVYRPKDAPTKITLLTVLSTTTPQQIEKELKSTDHHFPNATKTSRSDPPELKMEIFI